MPNRTPSAIEASVLSRIRMIDLPIRSKNILLTLSPGFTIVETPKLKVSISFMNRTYCCGSGMSSPQSWRISSSCSGVYFAPLCRANVCTGSPGCHTRNRKKASVRMSNRVRNSCPTLLEQVPLCPHPVVPFLPSARRYARSSSDLPRRAIMTIPTTTMMAPRIPTISRVEEELDDRGRRLGAPRPHGQRRVGRVLPPQEALRCRRDVVLQTLPVGAVVGLERLVVVRGRSRGCRYRASAASGR